MNYARMNTSRHIRKPYAPRVGGCDATLVQSVLLYLLRCHGNPLCGRHHPQAGRKLQFDKHQPRLIVKKMINIIITIIIQ